MQSHTLGILAFVLIKLFYLYSIRKTIFVNDFFEKLCFLSTNKNQLPFCLLFFSFSGVYGGNYGSNYRLNRFQGDRFETISAKLIKSLTNMQFVLHDGKGGTCPLTEDLIITYRGMKSRYHYILNLFKSPSTCFSLSD